MLICSWTEALQLMHEGDVWELYIPSDLAYGEKGTGKDIGPNSTLVFKVELIEILGGGGPAGGPPGGPPGGAMRKERRKPKGDAPLKMKLGGDEL